MNDRFKFRAFDKLRNIMVYCWQDATQEQEKLYEETYGWDETYNCWQSCQLGCLANEYAYPKEEFVVEQCTGLKDKNGKLIYEGDIIKIIDKSSRKEPFIGVVEYTNTASFESNCNGFYMHLHNPKTPENASMVEKMFCTSLREIEVLGNIHENADLIKVGGK